MFGFGQPIGGGGLPAAPTASGARDEPGPAASSVTSYDVLVWHVESSREWPGRGCQCDLCARALAGRLRALAG